MTNASLLQLRCEVKGELGPSLWKFSLVGLAKTRRVCRARNQGVAEGTAGGREGFGGCGGAAGKTLGEVVSENNCEY